MYSNVNITDSIHDKVMLTEVEVENLEPRECSVSIEVKKHPNGTNTNRLNSMHAMISI